LIGSTGFEFLSLEIAGLEFFGFILSGLDVIQEFRCGFSGIDFLEEKFGFTSIKVDIFKVATSLEIICSILSYFEVVVEVTAFKLGGTLGSLSNDGGSAESDNSKCNGSTNHDG